MAVWVTLKRGPARCFFVTALGSGEIKRGEGQGVTAQGAWAVSAWKARVRSSLARTVTPFSFTPTSNLRGACSHIS